MSENMTSLPSALSFALSVVQGCSKNVFQISSSTGSGSVASDGVIRFNLPSNSIMDWKNSKMNFSVETTATLGARLPQYADTLFSGVRIMVAGQTIVQNNNLHGVVKAVDYVTKQDVCDPVTGHPHVCETLAVDGKYISATNESETYAAGVGKISTLFSVDMGQIARISPRLIDMSLLGAVTVEFIVAPSTVLLAVKSTAPRGAPSSNFCIQQGGAPSFTIERPVFNAICYSLLSSSYQMAIKERIASIGYVSFVYPQTTGFVMGAWAGSNRFSLSANSLRKLTSVWRNRAHSAVELRGAVPLAGRNAGLALANGNTDGRFSGGLEVKTGQRHYQGRVQQFRYPNLLPVTDTTDVPAKGLIVNSENYADFNTTTSPLDFQFQVNSSNYPQYSMGVADCLQMTLDANNIDELHDTATLQEYLNNKFVVACGFNLPHKEGDVPCLSGLNTTGQNAYFGLASVGSGNDPSNYENIILAETDTIMRVGAMRQIEIIN